MNDAPDYWQRGFGLVMLLGSILALAVWFPNDIRGGFIETNQVGTTAPGDAFFPVMLAILILVLSIGLLASSFVGSARHSPLGHLDSGNLVFIGQMIIVIAIGLILMVWLGPLAVLAQNAVTGSDATYRALSDTAPYKYIGFAGGGLFLSLALIRYAAGSISWRSFLVALIVVCALILILDGLLTNVQLPPNADL